MKDVHPLHPALIQTPEPEYQVDPASQRFHQRDSIRAQRALPTGETTRGHPAWRWRPTVPPSSATSPPVIFSPTMLLPGGGTPASATPSIADVVARLKR
jgi:hypothetical protein